VHLLEPRLDEPELDRRLAGWADVCGREGSLEWLFARLQGVPAEDPAPRRFRRPTLIRAAGPVPAA